MKKDLVRKFIPGKEMLVESLSFEEKSQSYMHNSHDIHEKEYPSIDENPLLKFLSDVKNGNIRGQILFLVDDYAQRRLYRQKTGIRMKSQSQYLEDMTCFLKSEGLILEKQVRVAYLDTIQHN